METPDWNKLAGVDEAAERLKASKATPAELMIVRRIIRDFEALDETGQLVMGMFIMAKLAAMKPK